MAEDAAIDAPSTPEIHTDSVSSTCNRGVEAPASTSGADYGNSLDCAAELTEKGAAALKESDFEEAVQCFGRALEIRNSHYGELSPECFHSYYQYGRALLFLAQEEDEAADDASSDEDHEAGDEESHDEDESDLDLAWEILDIARRISEKNPNDTIDKVNVLTALADVSLEQDDIETSISDYLKALSILERLVEQDSRPIAMLGNFRICLCLEIDSKPQEAIPYCQRALLACNSRIQRLKNEVNTSSESSKPSNVIELEAEIETLNGLSTDIQKKLEDLQQLVVDPDLIPSADNGDQKNPSAVAIESSQMGTANSNEGFGSPTDSTGHPNGAAVTHLGVTGRGLKRVVLDSETPESSCLKKPALHSEYKGGDNN